jgi:uncharacterized damage-inducible protein DinB
MFRTLGDFLSVWQDESASTTKVLTTLTDASLSQAINNDGRTLGRIGWHLAQTVPEMLGKLGLKASGPGEHEPVPTSAKAILDAYTAGAKSVGAAIKTAGWTDAELGAKREMYGEQWTVGFSLRAFVFHEVHHRAQMTVLMRQAGLKPPGLYGPVREDWSQWGMQPPAV